MLRTCSLMPYSRSMSSPTAARLHRKQLIPSSSGRLHPDLLLDQTLLLRTEHTTRSPQSPSCFGFQGRLQPRGEPVQSHLRTVGYVSPVSATIFMMPIAAMCNLTTCLRLS